MRDRSIPPCLTRASLVAFIALLAAGVVAPARADQPVLATLVVAAERELAVVTISYNGVRKNDLAYIARLGDQILLDAPTLRRLGIPHDSTLAVGLDGRLLIPIEAIAGLRWSFDAKEQHLSLQADPQSLALNEVAYQFTTTPPPQLPHWGGFLNYALFGSTAVNDRASSDDVYGASTTLSLFGPYGVGLATVAHNSNPPANGVATTVLDVNWRWDDIPGRKSLLLGDTVTLPGWWGRAVRFAGLQYGTNFGLQPGFVTYPLLGVSGLATVPSTVDVLMNNVRVAEQPVPAGPFSITNLPTMTGAGEVNLIVRDALGRQQIITQSFYVAQQLLRPGLTEFSIGGGALRRNYGLTNFDYSGAVAYGWARHGFSDTLTAELRGEADDRGGALGAGADIMVGGFGVAGAGAAISHGPDGTGGRLLLNFDRQTPFVSFGFRGSRASRNFREIGYVGPPPKDTATAFARASLWTAGSVSIGIARQSFYVGPSLTIYTGTYSFNVGTRAYVTLGASQVDGPRRQTQALAVLTLPLDTLTSLTTSAQARRSEGDTSSFGEAVVQRSLPVGEGYGYYLRANTERLYSGAMQYAGRYGRYTVEAASDHGREAVRAGVSGGIAWIDDTWLVSQPIEQGFAVVRVGDLDNVRVLQANLDAGRTDKGRLALAQIPALNPVTVSIDPLSVPIELGIPVTSKQVVILPRTGVVINFEATRERSALVRLLLPDGTPIPVGSQVQIDGRPERFVVGYGGEVYLTNLAARQRLTVQTADLVCRVELAVAPDAAAIADLGSVTCQLGTANAPARKPR